MQLPVNYKDAEKRAFEKAEKEKERKTYWGAELGEDIRNFIEKESSTPNAQFYSKAANALTILGQHITSPPIGGTSLLKAQQLYGLTEGALNQLISDGTKIDPAITGTGLAIAQAALGLKAGAKTFNSLPRGRNSLFLPGYRNKPHIGEIGAVNLSTSVQSAKKALKALTPKALKANGNGHGNGKTLTFSNLKEYRNYLYELYAKQGNLKGQQIYVDESGKPFKGRSNGSVNIDKQTGLKVIGKESYDNSGASRTAVDNELTSGHTNAYKAGELDNVPGVQNVHHRLPNKVVDKIIEDLPEAVREPFIELGRDLNIAIGSTLKNLEGLSKDIHVKVHDQLNKAGLNPHKINMQGKTLAQRLEFLHDAGEKVKQISQYVFEEQMQSKHGNKWREVYNLDSMIIE